MANVSLDRRPSGLVARMAARYSRRRFGRLVDPVAAGMHHPGVLLASGAMETVAQRGWHQLDGRLRWLATQAAADRIGCTWCTDFGGYEGVRQGIDPRKAADVACFARSDAYDDVERAVLEYAVAATATPVVIPGQLVDRLHAHLSEAQIVELAAWVALENSRSRFNAGLGLTSQGFSGGGSRPGAAGRRESAAGAGAARQPSV
jgi:alkylhydroperoxidase family enzyme